MQISELNDRSREIFRTIVETYLDTGEPVGSQTVSKVPGVDLSAASVRNVMAGLEEAGLLESPHTSAGRLPTQIGLRLFVDGLLEIGDLSSEERREIENQCTTEGREPDQVLNQAIGLLSGLSHCAGLVMVPKTEAPVRHMEFVPLNPGQCLVVIVQEDGNVENRVIDLPAGLPAAAFTRATNFINARFTGRTLDEVRAEVGKELKRKRAELDELASKVIEAGVATWSGEGTSPPSLIVRGQAHLLENVKATEDLERIRKLFEDLESKAELARLLDSARNADGVRIFIGSENKLFSLSGSSLVVSPYMKGDQQIVGVIGVIGPTRLNYGRIIPMVDYTAKVVGRLLYDENSDKQT